MQIQRVQTGSETSNAAGPVQRTARGHHVKHVDPTRDDTDTSATDALDALSGSGTTGEATRPLAGLTPASQRDVTTPTGTASLHPRLAAYAQGIENRLANAAANPDLTPRQQAAIQQAQAQFHGLIQRLDAAHTSGAPADQKRPMMESLTAMIDQLVQNVNHITSGGPVDLSG